MTQTLIGRVLRAVVVTGLIAGPVLTQTASAQQDPGFFVPGGQQRPAQGGQRPAQGQPQRPAQAPAAQRPAAPPPLPAGQAPPAPVIGIVDIPEIQRVSTAFTQVREELERRRARLNEDLQREQNSWREAQQALATERAGLSADQIRTRERDLQDRITESQRQFRNRAQAIEQAGQAALVEFERALGTVIRQVAQSRSVNIVLPRPLVILNEPPFDLTEEIAQQLNRVLPRATVPAEGAAPANAPAAAPATPRQQPAQQPRR
ncbi:OmpH family outer membrane protein [Rhodovarius crocodyli]|uniref:OmpH family outer membrane protein n=1 Tax=Rhodovarius crocodyli TaxID=1979269 RepID=A0A437MJN0_9PROT|nr:OmpH family outer membrane protein [Rhodovarius crocodyli]RVT97829.1 OmpH family outer membrane protein [Rhodovarius crocodyli]